MPLGHPPAEGGDQWVTSFHLPMSATISNVPGSAAWPGSNRCLYMPVYTDRDMWVRMLWAFNGATASGNQALAIFDAAGNRLVTTGSVAQAGTSTIQSHDVTDLFLPAGAYYVALSHSNTTGTYFRSNASASNLRTMGMLQEATAHPPPSSMTGATVASGYWPLCGWTARTGV